MVNRWVETPLDSDPFATETWVAPTTPAPSPRSWVETAIDGDPFAEDQEQSRPWAFTRGLVSGLIEQNPENFGDALEGFSYRTGIDSLRSAADGVRSIAELNPEEYRLRSKGIIDSLASGEFGEALSAAGEGLGSALASTAPGLIGGLAGGAAGSPAGPVGVAGGAMVGAGGVNLIMAYGEIYRALKEEGVAPEMAADWAQYGAVPFAALDTALPGKVATRLLGAEAKREVARRIARRIMEEGAKGTAAEGATEAAQEVIKQTTVSLATGENKFDVTEIAESAIVGGLAGGAIGGASGVVADRVGDPASQPGRVEPPPLVVPKKAVIRDPGAPDDGTVVTIDPDQSGTPPGAVRVVTPEGGSKAVGSRVLEPVPESGRPEDAVDPAGPPLTPGDIASPLPNREIQSGKKIIEDALAGRLPQQTAPTASDWEPLSDEEDRPVGWFNRKTGQMRRIEDGDPRVQPVEPGSAAVPPIEPVAPRPPSGTAAATRPEAAAGVGAAPAGSAPEVAGTFAKKGQALMAAKAAQREKGGTWEPTEAPGGGWTIRKVSESALPVQKPDDDAAPAPAAKTPTREEIEAAAAEAATSPTNDRPEPTEAQKEAGNYKVGRIRFSGMDVSIENPKGSIRSKTSKATGKTWSVEMPAHYGRLLGTKGADGDHLDIYIGDDPASEMAFVIDQYDAETGQFDEHKIVTGVRTRDEAIRIYDAAFSDGKGPQRRGGVTPLTLDEMKAWATGGSTTKPLSSDRPVPTQRPAAAGGMDEITKSLPGDRRESEPSVLSYKGVKAGDSIEIPSRTGGPWIVEDMWERASGPGPMTMARVSERGSGKKLVVNAVELLRPPNAPKADPFDAKPGKKNGLVPKSRRGKEIGKNRFGQPVFEDERGVRSYVADGIRMTESVGIVPGGGITIDKTNRSDAFKTAEETSAETAARKNRQEDDLPEHPGLIIKSLQTGKETRIQPAGTRAPGEKSAGGVPIEDDRDRQRRESVRKLEMIEKAEAEKPAAKPAPAPDGGYGSGNKVFTADAAERARALLRDKLRNQINSGIDPEIVQAGITLAGYHIEAGARSFAAYSKAMIDDLGEAVRPYLRSWYEGVRYYPGFDTAGMTPAAEIDGGKAEPPPTVPAADARSEVDVEAVTRSRIAEHFRDLFLDGEKFDIVKARKEAAKVAGRPVANKVVEEQVEAGIVMAARAVARDRRSPDEIYDRLIGIYGNQPLLTTRTSTSVANQAYSTPAPLAFLASRRAGIGPDTTVYEPSAGNGMLLIEASPSKVYANELNPERVANLQRSTLVGADIHTGDGTQYTPPRKVDVVIANPPFGKVRDQDRDIDTRWPVAGYQTNQVDHAISWKALESMADDGRAVLIIGGQRGTTEERREGYRSDMTRRFFKTLYDEYNVVDHFTVDGKLYERQGAGWPVDVIVIQGRGKSALPYPMAAPPTMFTSWADLRSNLDDRVEDPRQRGDVGADPATTSPDQAVDAGRNPVRAGRPDLRAGVEGDAGAGARPSGGRSGQRGAGGRRPTGDGGGVAGGEQQLAPQPGSDPDATGAGAGGEARPRGNGAPRGGDAGDLPGGALPGDRLTEKKGAAAPKRAENTEAETAFQIRYEPTSRAGFAVGTLVPRNMQTAMKRALDALAARVGDIDQFVADRLNYTMDEMLGSADRPGYFSAEQVDALALAIDNVERGGAFILGDQTGVGKGRFVAAMLRYAVNQGRVPIFITKDPGLYADMVRDMRDIGMLDIAGRVLVTNNGLRGEKAIPLNPDDATDLLSSLPDSKQKLAIQQMISTGSLPAGYDMLFTTYSQLQYGPRGKAIDRQIALTSLAPNAMFVLDESHEAGGTDSRKFDPETGEEIPTRADFVRSLLRSANGVVYSSATYAKNPTVMSLYFKTDLSLTVDKLDDLGPTIEAGGVPLQQVIANMLVEAGQYARRERSYEGVEIQMDQLPTDRKAADEASLALRTVFALDSDYMEAVRASYIEGAEGEGDKGGRDGAVGEGSASGTGFAQVIHNVVAQMLLALKAPATVDRAIELALAGEKPIIALSNTNEAILNDFIEEEGLQVGDRADLTFNVILERYLRRLRRITLKDVNGQKRHVYLSDDEIVEHGGPDALEQYNAAEKMIREAKLSGLPASPVDYILDRLNAAGIKADEITGRGVTLTNGIVTARKASPAAKKAVMNAYNAGRIDALVINRSGSTGFSMHATGKRGNDGKQRHMILLQPDPNIDVFMQMLGRIHRTGQIKLPRYTLGVSDLAVEKRLAAVLMRKMASLNANTTASKRSAVSLDATDFMNKYGDEVVADFLRDNPEVADLTAVRVASGKDGGSIDGLAARLTGRLAIMPADRVAEIYQQIESAYTEYIEALDRLGQNAIEAKTLDLDARTIKTDELVPAKDGESPFSAAAIVETVDVRRLGKPYTAEEIGEEVEAEISKVSGDERSYPLAIISRLTDLLPAYKKKIEDGKARALAAEEAAKTEKQRDKAAASYASWLRQEESADTRIEEIIGTIRRLTPGSTYHLTTNQSDEGGSDVQATVAAVVLGIDAKKVRDNPTAMSAITVRLAIADASREVKLPLSKVISDGDRTARYALVPANRDEVMTQFSMGGGEARETRQIITGNLVSGFAVFKKGQFVMFTDSSGSTRQGILMPRDFDAERELLRRPVTFKSAAQIRQFLDDGQNRMVKTSDGIMAVVKSGYGYRLAVNTQGGKPYYLVKAVRDIIGDFSQRKGQKTFTNDVGSARDFDRVISAYQDNLGTQFETTSHKDEARAIVKKDEAAFSASPAGWGEVEAAPRPRLSEAELREIGEVIREVSGLETFLTMDTIPIPKGSRGAAAWGIADDGRTAGGFYQPVSDIITIALDTGSRRIAYHESFHRAQALFLTEKERATLAAATEDLRRLVASDFARSAAVAGRMSRKEVEAEAFAIFMTRPAGNRTGFPVRVRAILAKIERVVRAVRNWLAGRGFQTWENVFERAGRGEMARRAPRFEGAEDRVFSTTSQTDTPAFKRWFGNSKVVDDAGRPLVVYHGTGARDFDFDPTDPRITFSLNPTPEEREEAMGGLFNTEFGAPRRSVGEMLTARNRTLLQRVRGALSRDAIRESVDEWRFWFQDLVIDLKKVQREISAQTSIPISETSDAYTAYELVESRIGPRLERLHERMVEPLLREMHERRVSIDEIDRYLYARHAPERNARIAEINPAMPEVGSGMTDEEADGIMAEFRRAGKIADLAALAARVDALLRFAVNTRVEAGLLSEAQAEAWRAVYENYVPLRGHAELDPELENDRPRLGGSGVNVRGPESMRALGRQSEAAEILAHAISQAQEAIIRAERNRVGQALYNLAKENPNNDFWTVDKVEMKAVWNKKAQRVEYRPVRALTAVEADHTVSLKIDGVEHRVTFNVKNPRARRLAKGMRRLNGQQTMAIVRYLGAVNRWLSAVNTNFDPEFVITNAFRDMETAAVNLAQYDMKGLIAGTAKDYKSALAATMNGAFGRESGKWGRWYREFTDAGGRTYWNQVDSIQQLRARLDRDMADMAADGRNPVVATRRLLRGVGNTVEAVNMGVENAIRLAAYKNARERGMSQQQAASLAKNLTVNFNRRGAVGPLMNSFYLFYNASMQGTFVLLSAMKSRRVQKIAGGIVAFSAALTVYNLLASDEDDDGERIYDKISDFDKQRNLIIMLPGTGGSFIKIPFPYGYNVFASIGRTATEAAFGRDPLEAAADAVVTALDAFNPIGGSDNILKLLSPTIMDPIVELYSNRDFADRPIMPDQPPYGPPEPNAQRYWNSVSTWAKWTTDTLTELTGGDKVRPGFIDLSPEVLDYGLGVFAGAAGSFYGRAADTLLKLADPAAEITMNDIPFGRRLIGEKPSWYDKAVFYERAAEIALQESYVKGYEAEGNAVKRREVVAANKDLLALSKDAKLTRKELSRIRKERDELAKAREAGRITREIYTRNLAKLREEEQRALTAFNREYIRRVEGGK